MITPRQLRIREKAKRIQMMDKRGRRMKYIATNQSYSQAFRVNGTHCKHRRKRFAFHVYQGSGLGENMSLDRQKEIRSVFPNCDQPSCPKLGCSRSNEKPVEQVIEKNLNGQIPYQFLSRKWHKRRGKLMLKNRSRSKLVKAGGNLEQNIQALNETNKNFDPGTKRYSENKAMINAGTYILKNGPLVSTQELGVVLLGDKHNKRRKKRMPRSSELVRRLQTNLNVTYTASKNYMQINILAM